MKLNKSVINPSDNAFFLHTGIKNDITVIDIDDPEVEHNKKLIKMID